jgi:hypothetical protein
VIAQAPGTAGRPPARCWPRCLALRPCSVSPTGSRWAYSGRRESSDWTSRPTSR